MSGKSLYGILSYKQKWPFSAGKLIFTSVKPFITQKVARVIYWSVHSELHFFQNKGA